jgi:fluoroquinolone transport system permease protein
MWARVIALLKGDFRLQWRYGFCYAGAFVATVWTLGFLLIPAKNLPQLLPFLLFVDLAAFGFYFVAGLMLFERDEGVLDGLVVTPMRSSEYVSVRLISQAVLAISVSLVTVLAIYITKDAWGLGQSFDPIRLVLGITLCSLLFTLVGFIAAAPYDRISQFIMPSAVWVTVLQLPLLNYFDLWPSPLWWIMPTQGALWVLTSAFQPVEPWQLAFGSLYVIYWLAIGCIWAVRRFERFTVYRDQAG